MKALWGKGWETEGILQLNSLLKTDKMCEICQLGLLNICYCCSFQLPKGTYTHQDSQDQHGDSVHTTWYHCTQNREQTEEGQGGRRAWRPWHLCWGGGRKKNNKAFQESLHASTSEGRSQGKESSEKGMRNKGKVKKKEGNRKRNTKKQPRNFLRTAAEGRSKQTPLLSLNEGNRFIFIHVKMIFFWNK